jgi:hypothetical protein
VHNLVAEQADSEGANSNDDNSDGTVDFVVCGIDKLRADDGIHSAPTNASKNVEDSDKFNPPPAEPVSRQDHLAKTEARTESGEIANRRDTNQVEEENSNHRIRDSHIENSYSKNTNSER